MHRARADLGRVVERMRKRLLPFALAPGQRGEPRLALAADRRVDAELRQAIARKFGADRGRGLLVGVQKFDRAKTGRSGCAETGEQRLLAEQQTKIRSEAGHADLLFASCEVGQWGGSTFMVWD